LPGDDDAAVGGPLPGSSDEVEVSYLTLLTERDLLPAARAPYIGGQWWPPIDPALRVMGAIPSRVAAPVIVPDVRSLTARIAACSISGNVVARRSPSGRRSQAAEADLALVIGGATFMSSREVGTLPAIVS
jgi:hypothetical protein